MKVQAPNLIAHHPQVVVHDGQHVQSLGAMTGEGSAQKPVQAVLI